MSASDGRMVRLIGCFDPNLSAIASDPARRELSACKYAYRGGQVVLDVSPPSRVVVVRLGAETLDLTSTEPPQPFAITGILRVEDVREGMMLHAYASLEARRVERIHRIPVGPVEVIEQGKKYDIVSVLPIDRSVWEEFEEPATGARGQRVRNAPMIMTTYLQVVLKNVNTEPSVIRIYRVRPGGYYVRSTSSLRIVPDPSER